MFQMLDYRATKLYFILFAFPDLLLAVFSLAGKAIIPVLIASNYFDNTVSIILVAISLVFVFEIILILLFVIYGKIKKFIFELIIDVTPTGGRNEEEAFAVVKVGNKMITILQLNNTNPREWTDNLIQKGSNLDWLGSLFYSSDIKVRLEFLRQYFINRPELYGYPSEQEAALEEEGLAIQLMEKIISSPVYRWSIVSYILFIYALYYHFNY